MITEDGSATLKLTRFDEQFHSIHGAVEESLHVYIHSGFDALQEKDEIRVLEMGFGTGLNALLTLVHGEKKKIDYHGIEAFPVSDEEAGLLNYPKLLNVASDLFMKLHNTCSPQQITPDFYFRKTIGKIENIELETNYYDLIYYDAFSPSVQPELWTEELFAKLFASMRNHSILTTYCAKGSVKRAMKAAGFELESLSGPPGKREITRCLKS